MKICSRQGYFELMSITYCARSWGISTDIFLNLKICCVFLLESPHRGDSNTYTQYTIFNIKKKLTLNYPKSAAMGFFSQGTSERVRNRRGKSHQCSCHWSSTITSQLTVSSSFCLQNIRFWRQVLVSLTNYFFQCTQNAYDRDIFLQHRHKIYQYMYILYQWR